MKTDVKLVEQPSEGPPLDILFTNMLSNCGYKFWSNAGGWHADSFSLAPMYSSGRKYKCSEHHLFLIRLNVVTGSSNQPWACTRVFFCFFFINFLFPLSNQQEQWRDKCCFHFFTCDGEIEENTFNRAWRVSCVGEPFHIMKQTRHFYSESVFFFFFFASWTHLN